MPDVVVLGGGPIGLATAMLLARDGREVTVLEKDPQGVPATVDEAWAAWDRRGVAQFRQAHQMHARFRHTLDAEFPDIRDELSRSGGHAWSLLDCLPSSVSDRHAREDDDRFRTLTARRPIIERAFARVAEETPGVNIVRNVTIDGPLAGPAIHNGTPHVIGIRTDDGAEIKADLVIDAMGRRSRFPEWATSLGGRAPHEEITESGFAYYTRHYRSPDGTLPAFRGLLFNIFGSFMALTVPADNGTWCVAIVAMAGDRPLKGLRNNEAWEKVMRRVPIVAHWIDAEPVHDVNPMAGAMDRYRRFVLDGEPVLTGMIAVGDAWACTNPTAGRGISLGLSHAILLRDALRGTDEPLALARAFDSATEEQLTPWYRQQVDRDNQRAADIRAIIDGREPDGAGGDPGKRMQAAFLTGASFDPDIARAFYDTVACLALPQEVMARPGIAEKVASYVDVAPPRVEAPSRAELVALLN